MLKEKMWNKKKNWTETKSEGFWADFTWYLCEERKRINKEFQKEFRNKRICHTHSSKKKENRKRRKEKWQKEKTEDAFSNSLEKTTFFQIHQNRKVINVKLNEQENKKGELRQKTRNHFSRHRKTRQSRKNNCETCPTRKEPNKIVFLVKRRKQSWFLWRRKQKKKVKETIQDQEKSKIAKKWKKREYTARQERTSGKRMNKRRE